MDTEFLFDEMVIAADPFALCELHGQCDLGLSREPSATLHYVLAGDGEMLIQGHPPSPLVRGSLVLVPAMSRSTLRSHGATYGDAPSCRPAELNLLHLIGNGEAQGGTQGLVALCAHISLSLQKVHNLIDLVQTPVVEHGDPDSGLAAPFDHILSELEDPGLGSRAMIRSLLLQTMIELMRRRLAADDGGLSWMAALRDERLWPALKRMLEAPEEPHSVQDLAAIAGMSRSAFAKRFAEAYGRGPMDLLRDLRIRLACKLLEGTDLPVKRIAENVGFTSRSAFSRRFETLTGMSPRSYRLARHGER